ncbi:MAG: tRNA (adenosine(37)-N6)-threonylcarbamoyltransferase complex transferase subunit TsaD [Syntrophobacterales bacterium]|jgi:N6-L-threonylcarbamoyladenine synthase|nr:tRNA (adenosine(37)-N6)-threonylcarbamoyltransferase complex transferase subunit TsaD [Syntrophobacterales bacterium]
MIILGIDTSCDDTSVAIVEDGNNILSNIVSSQIDLHRTFGGVVPEIASRKHVELIDGLFKQGLKEAGLTHRDIDCVSVTAGPGLIGSVLVGLSFAKGLSLAINKPFIGVNHVEAHAMSIFLEREVEFPFVALVVSGGHTTILLMEEPLRFRVIGSTRDDAAGEAFDKIAKFLGIGYPGGRIIEEYARSGRGNYVAFPRPMINEPNYDFSFSGLKTAFINYIKNNGVTDENINDILASFQEAVFHVISVKTLKVAMDHNIRNVVVGGGVAANGRMREVFFERGKELGIEVMFSAPRFCTDNGAMVAATGWFYAERGIFSSLDIKGFSRISFC